MKHGSRALDLKTMTVGRDARPIGSAWRSPLGLYLSVANVHHSHDTH